VPNQPGPLFAQKGQINGRTVPQVGKFVGSKHPSPVMAIYAAKYSIINGMYLYLSSHDVMNPTPYFFQDQCFSADGRLPSDNGNRNLYIFHPITTCQEQTAPGDSSCKTMPALIAGIAAIG
jgi:hypothetical protein